MNPVHLQTEVFSDKPALGHPLQSGAARLDHLVVAAANLDDGVAWCKKTLGIEPGPGGRHALMGTHNRLFTIASEAYPLAYFEIIAIDPEAAAPGRPRWFGLDAQALRQRVVEQGPQFIHCVAAVSGLAATSALTTSGRALADLGLDAGEVLDVSRPSTSGLLRWQMLVRPDGQTLCGGAMPTLIDWGQASHPALQMPYSGVRLRSLRLAGLPPAVAVHLGLPGVETVAADTPEAAATAALQAVFDTPLGRVVLSSN